MWYFGVAAQAKTGLESTHPSMYQAGRQGEGVEERAEAARCTQKRSQRDSRGQMAWGQAGQGSTNNCVIRPNTGPWGDKDDKYSPCPSAGEAAGEGKMSQERPSTTLSPAAQAGVQVFTVKEDYQLAEGQSQKRQTLKQRF